MRRAANSFEDVFQTPNMAFVADSSVLINFLRIDRMDLLGRMSARFLVTEVVLEEIRAGTEKQTNSSRPRSPMDYVGCAARRRIKEFCVN